MKHFILSLLFVFTSTLVKAQGSVTLPQRPFGVSEKKDSSINSFLSKQSAFSRLSPLEQDMFYWVNLLRKDPSSFWREQIEPFLSQFPEARTPSSKTLKTDLLRLGSLGLLAVSAPLTNAARDHSDFMGRQQILSHIGSNGKDLASRLKEAGITGCAGENLYEGEGEALVGLILLLIDEGVPGAGHRKALLDDRFKSMGVGIRIVGSRWFMTQQFGCQ